MPIPHNLLILHKQARDGSDVAKQYRDKMMGMVPDVTLEDLDAALAAEGEPVSEEEQLDHIIAAALHAAAVPELGAAVARDLAKLSVDNAVIRADLHRVIMQIESQDETNLSLCRTAILVLLRAQNVQTETMQRVLIPMVAYAGSGGLLADALAGEGKK